MEYTGVTRLSVCLLWNVVFQTPPTVFKSSKWNLHNWIPMACRCAWRNIREFQPKGSRVMPLFLNSYISIDRVTKHWWGVYSSPLVVPLVLNDLNFHGFYSLNLMGNVLCWKKIQVTSFGSLHILISRQTNWQCIVILSIFQHHNE